MGREEGGGFRMGNTWIPVADSFRYLAKPIQYCKVKKKKKKKQHSMISSGIWAVSMFLDIISQAKLFSLLKEITFFESKYPDLKSEA